MHPDSKLDFNAQIFFNNTFINFNQLLLSYNIFYNILKETKYIKLAGVLY